MRRSDDFLVFLGLLLVLLLLAFVDAAERRADPAGPAARTAMVRRLGLTDPCLFTEARYTRHPSQADAFAPFQDHPQALEHFPTGSLLGAPPPWSPP